MKEDTANKRCGVKPLLTWYVGRMAVRMKTPVRLEERKMFSARENVPVNHTNQLKVMVRTVLIMTPSRKLLNPAEASLTVFRYEEGGKKTNILVFLFVF